MLPPHRCHADVSELPPGPLTLSPEESRHLVKARRAGKGADVLVFNGGGLAASGLLTRADPARAVVELHAPFEQAPAQPEVTLVLGGLKQSAWDEVLRHASELAATRLVWLQCRHAVAEVRPDKAAAKTARWRERVLQACKQSGNIHPPELNVAFSIPEAHVLSGPNTTHLLADPRSDLSLSAAKLPVDPTAPRAVWVGPEGDFSDAERDQLRRLGCVPVSLGPRVLRAETASLFMLSFFRSQPPTAN